MNKALISRLMEPGAVVSITAATAVIAVGTVFVMTNLKPAASYVHPTNGAVTESVESTGVVKAADSIDLSFQLGGRITNAGSAVGTHVNVGATLASLSGADLSASLGQARASLMVQQAKLDSLKAGARPEDIAVSQAAVSGAQSSLAQAKQSVLSAAQDAYIKSDDAIHNKADQFFNNPRTPSPTLALTLNNSQSQSSLVSGRISLESLLTEWQTYLHSLPSDPGQLDISGVASQTRTYLSQVSQFLDNAATALTQAVPTASSPLSTIQTFQTNIATARSSVSADVAALNSAETAEKSAESALASAQSQLSLKQAPATATDIAAQSAQVASAQASVDAAAAQLAKTVIVAPISGVITRNDAHIGETASPGSPLITLNSDSKFQIESYISEADIAKVKAGESASVTLDAYRTGVPFAAHVVAVDPAATVQSGVPSYKVTLEFDANDPRIQAGMTGNVTVTTARVASTLLVPTTAVITKGTATFVLRKSASGDELTAVTVGIAGGGQTQLLSGLSPEDSVRSFGNQ